MKRVARKISAAVRLFAESGFSGVVEYILGRLIPWIYRFQEGLRDRKAPALTLSEVEAFLIEVGVAKGSTLLVHSSWDSIKGSSFGPLDLIKKMRSIIGEGGTLAMPAYSGQALEDGVVLDVDASPSKAGWVSEVFRRMDGVVRSANVTHPVCAIGPRANFLLGQHHLGKSPWDEYSPYFRIGYDPESWIIGVGVPHRLRIVTSLHCVESILIRHPYFQKLFQGSISYSYVSKRYGVGFANTKIWSGIIYPQKIHNYFKGKLVEKTLGGVDFYAIRARDLIETALQLGLKGKTMLIWPIPWFWLFNSSRSQSARVILNKLYSLPTFTSN
jgi:aminoglycoside 3-N-acetyltransferase